MTHPSTTSPFSRSLRWAVSLSCLLIALFSFYVYAEKQIDAAHAWRHQAHLLADEWRQSADDLTRLARTYVITGDPLDKQRYLDVLAVREGTGPQGAAPAPGLPPMQRAGLVAGEIDKLAQAKANWRRLTELEFKAMALIDAAGSNPASGRLQASQMLHDAQYRQAQAAVMQPISEFRDAMDQRALRAVRQAEQHATWLRWAFVLVGLGLLLSLWRSYQTLRVTLGGSVNEVHRQINRIGQGDFSDTIAVAPELDSSVLGDLARTQRQLKAMAQAHEAADAKQRRLAELYAALSDCNQAIVHSANQAQLFEQVCRAAVEHGGMKMAWIGLLDQQSQGVRAAVSHGSGVEYLKDLHITVNADEPAGRGPTGITVREDRPYWCQDFQNDPATAAWHGLGARYGWAASAALPLHRDGAVMGTFNVYAGELNAFDERAQHLLTEMATDMDFALRDFDREAARARNMAQIMQTQQLDALRSVMLERLTSDWPLAQVLHDFVHDIENTMPGALCSILLLDQEGQHLHLGAAPSLPDFYNAAIDGVQIGPRVGSCGSAAFTGQRVVVVDIGSHPYWADFKDIARQAGLAACWSEPIRAGSGQVLGSFAIYHRAPTQPQPHELALIEMAARLTAITIERKQAELQLQLADKVFEQGGEGIMVTDAQGLLLRVNHAFCRITGYSEAEVLGRNPSLLASGRHGRAYFRQMWQALHEHGHWQGEVWNRRKDGSVYPEWQSISVLLDGSGAVTNYVAIAADISKRKHDEERIRQLADFDPLTGLPNRTVLRQRVEGALSHARRLGGSLALMFLDLDRFKNVNDSLGHPVGDALLILVAQRLKMVMREQDTLCRLGGDEFVLLCADTDAASAAHIAAKALEVTASHYLIEQEELAITFSIGIALYPTDGDSYEALFMSADTAMYRAKQAGRNTFCFFTVEMQEHSARTLQLENGLRRALELQQLHLVYQPQICLHDGRVVGMEALLRWQHPTLGRVSPAEFIPVAEDNGLILPIGEWVLRTAVRQMRAWLDAGLPVRQMAVNLSAVQFRQANLAQLVTEVLQEAGLPANHLELELTEGVAMDNPLDAIAVMDGLHQRGVRLSIDDFGTGYSSLSYLKRFSVYKLKIDQSFVRDLTDDPDDKAIVVAIIGLARSLGFLTIAEGVETPGQLAFLREQGCDEVQGYLYSQPLPAEQFEAFVRQHQAVPQPA